MLIKLQIQFSSIHSFLHSSFLSISQNQNQNQNTFINPEGHFVPNSALLNLHSTSRLYINVRNVVAPY